MRRRRRSCSGEGEAAQRYRPRWLSGASTDRGSLPLNRCRAAEGGGASHWDSWWTTVGTGGWGTGTRSGLVQQPGASKASVSLCAIATPGLCLWKALQGPPPGRPLQSRPGLHGLHGKGGPGRCCSEWAAGLPGTAGSPRASLRPVQSPAKAAPCNCSTRAPTSVAGPGARGDAEERVPVLGIIASPTGPPAGPPASLSAAPG